MPRPRKVRFQMLTMVREPEPPVQMLTIAQKPPVHLMTYDDYVLRQKILWEEIDHLEGTKRESEILSILLQRQMQQRNIARRLKVQEESGYCVPVIQPRVESRPTVLEVPKQHAPVVKVGLNRWSRVAAMLPKSENDDAYFLPLSLREEPKMRRAKKSGRGIMSALAITAVGMFLGLCVYVSKKLNLQCHFEF